MATNETDIDALQSALNPVATIGSRQVACALQVVINEDVTITCTPEATGADFCGSDSPLQALAALLPYKEITGDVVIDLADGVYGAVTPLSSIRLIHPKIGRIRIIGNTGDASVLTSTSHECR